MGPRRLSAPGDSAGGGGRGGDDSWEKNRGEVFWRLFQNEKGLTDVREDLGERVDKLSRKIDGIHDWIVSRAAQITLAGAIVNGLAIILGLWLAYRSGR